ncbi:MAG TPA: hypothetical protein H9903_01530 [Candidatus Aquabacterium excrementipullorum]|nr:hypothetical protein [Candidatus Aquabacterium excrementipullorum]
MNLSQLPWQDIVTWLIGLGAVAYLTRRWWPGSRSKAACHDTGGPTPSVGKTTGCAGSCSGCGAASTHAATPQTPRA